jgi:hypothetical protein
MKESCIRGNTQGEKRNVIGDYRGNPKERGWKDLDWIDLAQDSALPHPRTGPFSFGFGVATQQNSQNKLTYIIKSNIITTNTSYIK